MTVCSRGELKPVLTLGTSKTPFLTCSRKVKPRFNSRNYNFGSYNFNFEVIPCRYNFEVKILTPEVILALVLIPIRNKLRSLNVFLILIPMPEKNGLDFDQTAGTAQSIK